MCLLSNDRNRAYRAWISLDVNFPSQCCWTSSMSYWVRLREEAVSPMADARTRGGAARDDGEAETGDAKETPTRFGGAIVHRSRAS